jgi:putative ATPase
LYGQRTTLFVDEDALLPHVENGVIILIGATTENPYFEVNKALVSRSRIFQLKPLTEAELRQVARQAIEDEERGYGRLPLDLHDDALDHLVNVANGDARAVLNALELAVETTPPNEDGRIPITLAVAEESIQRRAVLYDKEGDVHYDTISAFIKSLRGSDPDAALYWMARMVYAGEDPRFIFRRMTILAGEDVGMADPQAMSVVVSCWEAFERIGMPEGRFHLAQAALYLATAPKSNSAFAFFDALEAVGKEQEANVPTHLKDASRDGEGFGHGQGYLYPHAYRDHWVAQQYLPDGLQGRLFYQPGDQGYERQIGADVARKREAQLAAMLEAVGEWPLGGGETYTTSPTNKGKDAWLQRILSQAGENLAGQRARLFELIAPQRHHLLLDLNAGSGLLTWEAARRAPEGGVWALAHDAQSGEALRQQAERLPEVERPSILIGLPADLPRLLTLRDETAVRFDRIIGRNLFTRLGEGASPEDLARLLRDWLTADGRLALIQLIPRQTQRLVDLADWSGEDADLAARARAAEEAIYQDAADPLVNWTAADIEAGLRAGGLTAVTTQVERQTERRRISAAELARWFAPQAGERPSYAQRLAAGGLTAEEIERVAALYGRQLRDQLVAWQTAVAYIVGKI